MDACAAVCAQCHQSCSGELRCPRPCGIVYCDKNCQRRAWKAGHKAVCAGRVQRYPIQQVVDDATVTVCRSPFLCQEAIPEENVLACIVMDTLQVDGCTYQASIVRGPEECQALIDWMVRVSILKRDGQNHTHLLEYFGAAVPPSVHGGLLGVVLRIRSLQMGEQCFDSLGQDPKDARFIRIRPNTAKPPAIGTTRLAVRNYIELLHSQLPIRHFPLVLTGQRAAGSPIEAAMAEQDAAGGRECAVCGEVKSHTVLSSCDHAICYECGQKWHRQCAGAVATCPICRQPWNHFDTIYSNTIEKALESHFERSRCCWCGRIAQYRCRCQCFDYCSPGCRQQHAVQHSGECIDPWFLPEEERLTPDRYLHWTGTRFEEVESGN